MSDGTNADAVQIRLHQSIESGLAQMIMSAVNHVSGQFCGRVYNPKNFGREVMIGSSVSNECSMTLASDKVILVMKAQYEMVNTKAFCAQILGVSEADITDSLINSMVNDYINLVLGLIKGAFEQSQLRHVEMTLPIYSKITDDTSKLNTRTDTIKRFWNIGGESEKSSAICCSIEVRLLDSKTESQMVTRLLTGLTDFLGQLREGEVQFLQ